MSDATRRNRAAGHGSFRELAHRESSGVEVTLLWSEEQNRLAVTVSDLSSGECFVLDAENDNTGGASTPEQPTVPQANATEHATVAPQARRSDPSLTPVGYARPTLMATDVRPVRPRTMLARCLRRRRCRLPDLEII
jgi:hypothetical protein